MSDLARELDARLSVPVLVVGRHVPGPADLHLAVTGGSVREVPEVLSALGFEQRGDTWARFRDCQADVVTVTDLDRWPGIVPDSELVRLLADSGELAGTTRLRWLSLPDELLVAALRFARCPSPVPAAVRQRLHGALTADPSAWVVAAERAVGWRAEAAVRVARDAYDGARTVADTDRREMAAMAGEAPTPTVGVVALSGLDGSGKSTQAHALAATLMKLGHDTSLEWTRLSFDARLDLVAAPVKAALAWRHRGGPGGAGGVADVVAVDAASKRLRARSRLVDKAWTGVVAAANGTAQRHTTLAQLRAGRVVVRDRYVLDSVVQLRSVYGADRDVTAQARIIERLSPSPIAAFLLELPAEEAYRRKPEEYSAAELAAHAVLYEQEADRLGVVRISASRPRAQIAAEIGRTVWRLLT
jgi:thymidylate kinase